jgi:hypothetical protein
MKNKKIEELKEGTCILNPLNHCSAHLHPLIIKWISNGFPLSKCSPKVANNSSRKNKGVIIMFLQSKKALLNLPFVKNPIESIDFKTFCKGGSPDYVEAKQKVNDLYHRHQQRNLTAYSLYINPLSFIDVHFALAAGAVVLFVVIEKKLAENGFIGIASVISDILNFSLPVIAFGSVIYFISQLGVFL